VANGRLILPDDRLPFTPAQFGLLSAATELTGLENHWQMGLSWQPLCADATATYAACTTVVRGSPETIPDTTPPDPAGKTATFDALLRGATPFTVYVEHDCSPSSGPDVLRKRAADALTRVEESVVEAVVWSGQAGGQEAVFPHLAADAGLVEEGPGPATFQEAAVTVATPLGPVDALSELEGALAGCYKGVGTLHIPRKLIPRLASQGVLKAQGGLLTTILGTKVAAGTGYPGTGPAGTEAAGVEWMYATGAVFYARGDIFQPRDAESFDRARNTVKALAERTYVVGWDCCVFATPVTISEGGAS
jgi:hypothetical protein